MTVDGMAHSAWPGADDELTLGLYMIDVEREQVYRSNGASRKVKKIANKVFAKYLEDHSRVMPTAVAATGAAAVSQPAQPIAKESSATVAPVTVAKAAPATRSAPYKIAILPFETDGGYSGMETWMSDYLTNFIRSDSSFTLMYSFYGDGYSRGRVPKTEKLWVGGAVRKKPNLALLYATGRQLGVDAIVVSFFEGWTHGAVVDSKALTVELYLIDVVQRQVYYRKGQRRGTKKLVRQTFAEFASNRSKVVPTAVAATGAAAVSQPAQPIAKESSATVAPVTVAKAAPVTGGATGPMRTITLPSGTQIFGELESRVSSSKKGGQAQVGDLVKAHVWRDVVVDNHVVIKAGAPMVMKVGAVKGAQLAGIKGKIRVDAVSVNAVDGSQITLTGGYDGSGKGRVGTIAAVWVAVGVFALLVKGHEVVVEPGVVFDAALLQPATIAAYGPPIPPKQPDPVIQVEVLYDLIDLEKKLKKLPLRIRRCNASLADARVVAVNGSDILDPIPVKLESTQPDGNCTTAEGTIKMKALLGHFNKGINLFEVEAGGQRKEVLLELEL
ncbi:MAG: hypothetical protein ACE5H7_15795 [Acidiferrobacterales bacterium]